MEYGINDLSQVDFDDEDDGLQQQEPHNYDSDPDGESEFVDNNTLGITSNGDNSNPFAGFSNDAGTGDVLMDYLKYNGITDPAKIKFEREDGIIEEVNWDNLNYNEKMNILRSSSSQPERDLEDNEIAFINNLRSSNMTPEQYIQAIKNQTQKELWEQYNNTPRYSIDDLTDDEIFILDLQDKIEDLTDEEILNMLDRAKENESLYRKQVNGLRKALKSQEETLVLQQQEQAKQLQEEQFNRFKNDVITNIQGFNKIGDIDIDLDNDDMEDVAAFILDTDDTGMSYFGKALNDPKTLVEMAWFALKGRDAFKSINDYYANEIKNVRQKSYEKGLADGKNGTSRVVINNNQKSRQNSQSRPLDYRDLLG